MTFYGRLAQRLERSVYTRKVVRSNRTVPTTPLSLHPGPTRPAQPPDTLPGLRSTALVKYFGQRAIYFYGAPRSLNCQVTAPYPAKSTGPVNGTTYGDSTAEPTGTSLAGFHAQGHVLRRRGPFWRLLWTLFSMPGRTIATWRLRIVPNPGRTRKSALWGQY